MDRWIDEFCVVDGDWTNKLRSTLKFYTGINVSSENVIGQYQTNYAYGNPETLRVLWVKPPRKMAHPSFGGRWVIIVPTEDMEKLDRGEIDVDDYIISKQKEWYIGCVDRGDPVNNYVFHIPNINDTSVPENLITKICNFETGNPVEQYNRLIKMAINGKLELKVSRLNYYEGKDIRVQICEKEDEAHYEVLLPEGTRRQLMEYPETDVMYLAKKSVIRFYGFIENVRYDIYMTYDERCRLFNTPIEEANKKLQDLIFKVRTFFENCSDMSVEDGQFVISQYEAPEFTEKHTVPWWNSFARMINYLVHNEYEHTYMRENYSNKKCATPWWHKLVKFVCSLDY